jgi:hypothetical protein
MLSFSYLYGFELLQGVAGSSVNIFSYWNIRIGEYKKDSLGTSGRPDLGLFKDIKA